MTNLVNKGTLEVADNAPAPYALGGILGHAATTGGTSIDGATFEGTIKIGKNQTYDSAYNVGLFVGSAYVDNNTYKNFVVSEPANYVVLYDNPITVTLTATNYLTVLKKSTEFTDITTGIRSIYGVDTPIADYVTFK